MKDRHSYDQGTFSSGLSPLSVEKWWNEICDRGKREEPREKPTQTPFLPLRNPHGVTEMRPRYPSGRRRASNHLRHGDDDDDDDDEMN